MYDPILSADDIALRNFHLGAAYAQLNDRMRCPLCGYHLHLGPVVTYEPMNIGAKSIPSVVFICHQATCALRGKGFFGLPAEGVFYPYCSTHPLLTGQPLKGWVPDLAISVPENEKHLYDRRGRYVGAGWRSRLMAFIRKVFGSK